MITDPESLATGDQFAASQNHGRWTVIEAWDGVYLRACAIPPGTTEYDASNAIPFRMADLRRYDKMERQ